MLNGVLQSVNDANERSRQTLQPFQSLWLAHWKRTNSDATGETSSPDASISEELDCTSRKGGRTKGLEASLRSANGLGKIKNTTFEIGADFIKAGRRSVGNERIFNSVFKDGQDADDVQVLSPKLAQNLKAVHSGSGSPSCGCHSVEEDTSNNPPKLMKIRSARKDSMFVESSSHTLPYMFDVQTNKFDKGKAAMSVGSIQGSGDMRMLKHELFCEKKVGYPLQSDISSNERFRESISCGLSMSKIGRGWFMETRRCSGIRQFPSQSNSSEEYETTKFHNDCCTQLKLQKCVHGVGTIRMCSSADVSGGTHAGFPRFSRTNIELSAETDTMSMDSSKDDESKKNLHSASNMTTSAETLNTESTEVAASKEAGHGRLNYKVPDINLKPAAETEKLVERVNQPRVKRNSSVDEFPNADAGNRWVKRLKLSSSSSSYHESRGNSNKTGSKRGEKSLEPDMSIETGDDKGKSFLLSDGWIRRWRRIKSKGNSGVEAMESSNSSSSSSPSIAAMALMAKALTCFQQCELQKMGSYTVWNSRTPS